MRFALTSDTNRMNQEQGRVSPTGRSASDDMLEQGQISARELQLQAERVATYEPIGEKHIQHL